MATATTHAEIAARLARQVERHGCGSEVCDLCADLETCLATPARPVAARLPAARTVATSVDGGPVETLAEVFGAELDCY